MRRIPRPSPAMVVALVGVAMGLGGVAFATIPDSNGTIHGCYDKKGDLRVVESAADCKQTETAIQWNQRGGGSVRTLGDVTLSQGESRALFSQGPVSLVARCGTDVVFVQVSTTEDHTAFSGGFAQGRSGEIGPGNPGTGFIPNGALRPILRSEGPQQFASHDFSVAAPDGTRLSGVLNLGIGVLGRGDQCVFGGHVVVG